MVMMLMSGCSFGVWLFLSDRVADIVKVLKYQSWRGLL
jgi:hypothetical protein